MRGERNEKVSDVELYRNVIIHQRYCRNFQLLLLKEITQRFAYNYKMLLQEWKIVIGRIVDTRLRL